MLVSKDKLIEIIDDRVRYAMNNEVLIQKIAVEYLLQMNKAQMNKFIDAVELRRKSEDKLGKLDSTMVDETNNRDGLEYEG